MSAETTIRLLGDGEDPPWALLLDADPSREMVERYLGNGEVYVLELGGAVVGVIVLRRLGPDLWEIKNIAVDDDHQGRGLGRQLLTFAIQTARDKAADTLRIGTGNSSFDQLALYQKMGFRMTDVDRGFFTRNPYPALEENGIAVTDMVVLEMAL